MKTRACVQRFLVVAAAMLVCPVVHGATSAETARWQREAQNVTIVRDNWGIAHVYGKTDADVVFGMEYAQAEDDFNRVETNYLNAMGRLAETEGEGKIYQDLRMKLFIDPAELKDEYAKSPAWLKTLMDAFADGLNFYLAKHPGVKPRVIQHFEPWMALSFTEGSIGGDMERVDLAQLEGFYGKPASVEARWGKPASVSSAETALRGASETVARVDVEDELMKEPTGSNGIAIGPSNTADHHSLLLINPHTSFFFRSELQMVSDEGLNAYGAVTWGQFFIYQGFNDRAGWMHTSSGVDAVDEFKETVSERNGKFFYKYGSEERPMVAKEIVVPYKTANGMAEKRFTIYKTHHGPVTRRLDGKWVTIALMQRPIEALEQSYLRTKARNYKEYWKTMELMANSSNNTIFADADGDIAYWHGNYIPKRDARFDFTKPVDGSDPATDWHGLMTVDQVPHLLNPKSGWLYNSNNWPWSGAGADSLKKADFPVYVETGTESARGLHAVRVLKDRRDFTLDSLIGAAYDSYLPWFEVTLPALVKAWDEAPAGDATKAKVAEQIRLLRGWDRRWSVDSVPTSLAVFWGEEVRREAGGVARGGGTPAMEYVATKVPGKVLLASLAAASDKLAADFGAGASWKIPWGEINRYQRVNGAIVQPFDDAKPSIPVGFTSSLWGSLASFGAKAYPETKKWYGTSGNSFVAVVEFGEKVKAKAVTAGGESGDPASKHFGDQALRYSKGDLRDVYFYRDDVKGHTEREYHPGS